MPHQSSGYWPGKRPSYLWQLRFVALSVVFSCTVGELRGAALEHAKPAEIGLSQSGLDAITAMLDEQVRAGKISGAVAAISRHGRLGYLQAVGSRDLEADLPMEADTIFRIASMTKTITSAGIMMLREDGRLALDDPLANFLPEFATPHVLASIDGSDVSTKPAARQPTIGDLLTHVSGLTYGWFGPEHLDAIYRQHDIPDLFIPIAEPLADRVERIAQVPLKFQPGTAWEYGVSTDVLGRVIEVVTGLTLEQFFYERFFRPLHMHDTHFYVPREKVPRLAALYTTGDEGQLRRVTAKPVSAGFLKFSADYCLGEQQKFFSGGGGLVSTVADYLRFLEMLRGGGELDGVRILRSETVALMTKNQIGDLQIPFGGHGDGFGFGFGVMTDRGAAADVASVGSYSWGGIFNTYYWVDPQENLIGILMTQLFPYDHLNLREEFKRRTYEAVDDAGFTRVYWYEQGAEHANPYFNRRQLRVNAAEASVHPSFADRSEPRSSGMARILVDEDIRNIRRADLYAEIWGGHPGTTNKRVSVNGRSLYRLPEVGTASQHCTQHYPALNLRPTDLVRGYNSLQFACDQGETFWGHYIVENVALAIGLAREDERLQHTNLQDFTATVKATPDEKREAIRLQLEAPPELLAAISRVHYQGKYLGFDENGNTWRTDWHGMTKGRIPYGMIGTSSETPYEVTWDTTMLPAQERVSLRAFLEFKDHADIFYTTPVRRGLAIRKPDDESVRRYVAGDLPRPFWSRAGKRKECTIELDVDSADVLAAQLHVLTWTGGAGGVEDYFTLNGQHFPVAEGDAHELVYSRLPVEPAILQHGDNRVVLHSDTEHHGIEVMLPGPTLVVRQRKPPTVRFTESARDESAGGLECYKIETPQATYYLEKIGAGLASMIDRDGHDWLSFHPQAGSGAAGEYRGFPNAVHRQGGSYFHPKNDGTDPSVTFVEEVHPERVVISALSGNGQWAGRYEFTVDSCIFTLTKMPAEKKYWVLYEGTPGGTYDDSDWWMTSGEMQKQTLLTTHEGDIAAPEWIAFGDQRQRRVLFLAHLEDDAHTDRFYQMQKKMTVFGFGRDGSKKMLSTVPQSFAIGFADTTDHTSTGEQVAAVWKNWLDRQQGESLAVEGTSAEASKRKALERFALTHRGDAEAGRELFRQDERAKCSTCHRVQDKGGQVGPDLSKIGGKFDRPHLIESLLEPSRQIVEGYRTSLIMTDEGRVHAGIVKSSDETSVTIVDASNKMHEIAVEQIDEQMETAVSMMPLGVADLLSPQEFTDLIAYLQTLHSSAKSPGSTVTGPLQIPAGFDVETVTTGLTGATAMEVTPDGRLLICEQPGRLRVIKNGRLLPDPFVTLPVENYWERGLIGVTVAPDFPHDPHVYVVYVAKKPYPHHRVSRFRARGDGAVAGSEEILLRGDDQRQLGGNVPAGHQGGAIHFGNDGKLYIAIGEQTAKKPAQRLDSLLGKLLRINPDGTIPADNPFLDQTKGKYRAIWAIGCRNPFTFAIHQSTDTMLINDVGGNQEEINRGSAGANFGWPVVDHGPTERADISGPIHCYPQASISGGDFLDKRLAWPHSYRGLYFFADYVHGWIKAIDPNSPEDLHTFANGLRRPVDLRFSDDGSLYVLLRNAWVVDDKFEDGTGSLLRIKPRTP